MSHKPPGYYEWDYVTRRSFDDAERQRSDAEYIAQQNAEEADRMRSQLRQAESNSEETMRQLTDRVEFLETQLDAVSAASDELMDAFNQMETDRDYAIDFIARKQQLVEFLAWHRTTTTMSDGTCPDRERFAWLNAHIKPKRKK